MSLLTIGHGYESQDDFLGRLHRHEITHLVDVRSFPGSRRSPHFGRERMTEWVTNAGVNYSHQPYLGGRRKPPRERIPTDGWWRVESFANYAAHTRTTQFQSALRELLQMSDHHDVAIVCGEPCWWRCHRRMIADVADVPVRHIMPDGSLSLHQPSEWAKSLHADVLM